MSDLIMYNTTLRVHSLPPARGFATKSMPTHFWFHRLFVLSWIARCLCAAQTMLIKSLHTQQTLDLRGNNMGNDGAIQVSRGMRQHQNAKFDELDLSYNEIKDDGAFALAQALKVSRNFQ